MGGKIRIGESCYLLFVKEQDLKVPERLFKWGSLLCHIQRQTFNRSLLFLPPSPWWQAKTTQATAKLHANRENVPYVIFSVRENGSGLFLRTLYSPYTVDRARTIATHQQAILNKYVQALQEKGQKHFIRIHNFKGRGQGGCCNLLKVFYPVEPKMLLGASPLRQMFRG